MVKPKNWVKMSLNLNPTSTFTFNCTFFIYIFKPTFGLNNPAFLEWNANQIDWFEIIQH